MKTPPQAPLMRFKLLSGADLCNAPPMRWMVRGVLPVEGLAALFGASGSGKSFLMLDIAVAVAGGDYEWFGRRVTQCPVTYVCLEGEAGMGKRATAKQVIETLQSWVDHKDNSDAVAELTGKIPNGVKWVTSAGKENNYDIGACQKTLETWNKSRA